MTYSWLYEHINRNTFNLIWI